jgi:hypothetical protein
MLVLARVSSVDNHDTLSSNAAELVSSKTGISLETASCSPVVAILGASSVDIAPVSVVVHVGPSSFSKLSFEYDEVVLVGMASVSVDVSSESSREVEERGG